MTGAGISVTGSAGADTITGSAQADIINGGGGLDVITGGAGADIFLIGAGADHGVGEVITGGTGPDTIRFTSTTANDTLTLRVGVTDVDDLIYVVIGDASGVTTGTTALNVNADALVDTLRVNLTGNDGANILTGNALADTIAGGLGADSISGGAGDDILTGGDGADTIIGGAGVDNIDAGAQDDVIVYATLSDFVSGSAIVDQISGSFGTDTIRIDASGFTIASTDSFARALRVETLAAGSATASAISITLGANAFAAGAGINTVTLAADTNATGSNLIDASLALVADTLTLTGSAGIDDITGGGGADTITGGAGADNMTGGAGADTFVTGQAGASVNAAAVSQSSLIFGDGDTFNFSFGVDIITDFISGTDKLDVATAGVAATDGNGLAATLNLVTGTTYSFLGTYNAGTAIFTLDSTAIFSTTDVAMLFVEGDAGSLNFLDTTGYTLLRGVYSLGASDFI